MRCQGCRQSFDGVFKWQTPGAGGGWSKHRWVASTPLSHLNLGRLALRPLAASTARAQLPVTQISDLCLHRIPREMNWKTWTGFFYDRERPGVEGCDRANPDSRSVFCVLLLRQFLLWGEVVVFLLSWGGWGCLMKYCISSFPQLINLLTQKTLPPVWMEYHSQYHDVLLSVLVFVTTSPMLWNTLL